MAKDFFRDRQTNMGPEQVRRQIELHGMGPGQPGDVLRPTRTPLGRPDAPMPDSAPVAERAPAQPVNPAPPPPPAPEIDSDAAYTNTVAALKEGRFKSDPDFETEMMGKAVEYKRKKGQEKTQRFAESIDYSPAQVPDQVTRMRDFEGMAAEYKHDPSKVNPFDKYIEAANKGIDIETGAPASIRAKAGLLRANPKAQAAATEWLLARELEKSGVQLPDGSPAVFHDDVTGEMAYWRPDGKGGVKPTLLSPPGLGNNKAYAALTAADFAAGLVPEVAGTMLGAMASGPAGVVGGAAGMGAGNMAANKARKEAAAQLGLPQEIIDQVTSDDILHEGLISAGFGVGVPAVVGAVRWLGRKAADVINGTTVLPPGTDIAKLKEEAKRAIDDAIRLEKATGVPAIEHDIGSATGDPDMLVMAADARSQAAGATSQRLVATDIRNRQRTGEAVLAIHAGEMSDGLALPQLPGEIGPRVRNVLNQPLVTAESRAKQAEVDQMEQLAKVADQPNGPLYPAIQEDIRAASQAAYEHKIEGWNNFRAQIEYNPKTRKSGVVLSNQTANSPINTALRTLDRDGQMALSKSQQAAEAGLARDMGYKAGDDMTGVRLNSPTLDMNQLHKLLSHLKDAQRNSALRDSLGWKGHDLNTMVTAVERQIKNGKFVRVRPGGEIDLKTGQSGPAFDPIGTEKSAAVRMSYEEAKARTVAEVEMFSDKGVKEVLKQNSKGEWLKPPAAVRTLVFTPNNAAPLNDVLHVIGSNPAKRSALLEELNGMYRRAVMNDAGEVSSGAHSNFMAAYQDHINLLTGGKGTTDFISTAADLNREVIKQRAQAQIVKSQLETAYGRTLGVDDMYGGRLAKDFMGDGFSVEGVMRIRDTISRSDPGLWAEIKEQGLKMMQESMLAPSGEASASAINTALSKYEAKLGAIYGPNYVKNLKLLQTVVNDLDRKGMASASHRETYGPVIETMRSVLGQLNPHQRKLSAVAKMQNKFIQRERLRVASNPDELDKYMRLAKQKPGTYSYLQAYMQAGFDVDNLDPATAEVYKQQQSGQRAASPTVKQLRDLNSRPR